MYFPRLRCVHENDGIQIKVLLQELHKQMFLWDEYEPIFQPAANALSDSDKTDSPLPFIAAERLNPAMIPIGVVKENKVIKWNTR